MFCFSRKAWRSSSSSYSWMASRLTGPMESMRWSSSRTSRVDAVPVDRRRLRSSSLVSSLPSFPSVSRAGWASWQISPSAGALASGGGASSVLAAMRWRFCALAHGHAQAVQVALEGRELELVALLDVLEQRRELHLELAGFHLQLAALIVAVGELMAQDAQARWRIPRRRRRCRRARRAGGDVEFGFAESARADRRDSLRSRRSRPCVGCDALLVGVDVAAALLDKLA